MDHSSYVSPLSWRYGSDYMRQIWSLEIQRYHWRHIWTCMAKIQMELGVVSPEQYRDIQKSERDINLERSLEIEKEVRHDLVAELRTFAEQCTIGGSILHLGATSEDIKDNAMALSLKDSLEYLSPKVKDIMIQLKNLILDHVDVSIMGYTHLQPAEKTTVAYRLSQHLQDLLEDYKKLISFEVMSKGFKGAVGTYASYLAVFGDAQTVLDFEKKMSEELHLNFWTVTTQTSPRKQDLDLVYMLSSVAQSFSRLALNIRLMQSQGICQEPFADNQVGSSAMPYKRNPVACEKINSLARLIPAMCDTIWENAASNMLERTMDDSANRRLILPSIFLMLDEMLITMKKVLEDISFTGSMTDKEVFLSNIDAAISLATKRGGDRQNIHEQIRTRYMQHGLKDFKDWLERSDISQHITYDDILSIQGDNSMILNSIDKLLFSVDYVLDIQSIHIG